MLLLFRGRHGFCCGEKLYRGSVILRQPTNKGKGIRNPLQKGYLITVEVALSLAMVN